MSAAKRVAHAAETIRARWERDVKTDPQTEAAQALDDTCQLLDPEVAEELERLRKYVVTRQAREEELLATLGRIDLRRSPEAWSLGMTFIAHMDGPFSPCTAEELEPGLRALVGQLRAKHADEHDELAMALGRSSDTEWGDLVEIAAGTVTAEVKLQARIAELEAAQGTIYRAEHPDSGITLGHYATAKAARDHCEETERRSWPTGTTLVFDWIEDDEDRVAELVVTAGQNDESVTGYLVTALALASEYDAEADE